MLTASFSKVLKTSNLGNRHQQLRHRSLQGSACMLCRREKWIRVRISNHSKTRKHLVNQLLAMVSIYGTANAAISAETVPSIVGVPNACGPPETSLCSDAGHCQTQLEQERMRTTPGPIKSPTETCSRSKRTSTHPRQLHERLRNLEEPKDPAGKQWATRGNPRAYMA